MSEMPLVVGGSSTFLEEGKRAAEEGRIDFDLKHHNPEHTM
jgi:hypothetical protein